MNDELEVETHDFEEKIEIEKLIQMLLLSSDVGSSVSSDPQFVEAIRKLSKLRLDELASTPQRIQREEDSIRHKTEQLAVENYPIFLANANTSREVHREFMSISDSNENLISSIAGVSGVAQTIFDNIGKNASAFRTSAKAVQKCTQISDFLELPQLMETCIQNGHYQDALNILNHTKQMTKKYGRTVPIVRIVGYQAKEISGQLFSQLCKQLREPITLPVVIYLRQLEAFTEQELRLNFLQARGLCIKDQLEVALAKPIGVSNFDAKSAHISVYQQAEYKAFIGAMRRIEVTRVQLFDSITQYRAVFADEESYSSKLPDPHQQPGLADISPLYLDESTRNLRYLATNQIDDLGPCNEGSLFHSWLVRQIGIFLDGLSGDLNVMLNLPRFTASEISDRIQLAMANDAINLDVVDTSTAFQQIHSIMTQAFYFGRSFARIGCDFRAHLGSLFSRYILTYFETLMSNALTEFGVVIELWPWELVEPSFLSSQSREGNPEELQAPFEIARHPAIAFFCNRVLSAFNGLRICCPVTVRDGVLSACIRTLNGAANAIVSAHKSRQLDSPTARNQSIRFASVFAHTATPHLLTCLLEHIFGGDAASHLWQLHQESDENLTTSQLISRFSKDVSAPIFDQWGQLAHNPLWEGQSAAFDTENGRYGKTLQAAKKQDTVESKPSTDAQNEAVTLLINSPASETPKSEVVGPLEQSVPESAPTDEVELPKNNVGISDHSPLVSGSPLIPTLTVVQPTMDQQTVPKEEESQLSAISNAKETDSTSEPEQELMDKIATSELSEHGEGEGQLDIASISGVQCIFEKPSPLASEDPMLSGSASFLLKSGELKAEHQENAEPLSTFKSEFDEVKVGNEEQLIESSYQTPSTQYPETSHSSLETYTLAEHVESNSEMKEDFLESEHPTEPLSTKIEPSQHSFQYYVPSEFGTGVEVGDQIYDNPVDENSSSGVLDQVGTTSLHATPDSAVFEQSDAMNSGMKSVSDEIPFCRAKTEDKREEQIAQEFATDHSSVTKPISDLKFEESDEPNYKSDEMNYTDQSCSQAVNPEVSNIEPTDLSRTMGLDESASIFMDQFENVPNNSSKTEMISEVYNEEYAESRSKVENIKMEEGTLNQAEGVNELPTMFDQVNQEMTCNTRMEEIADVNKEVPLKSELKASVGSLETPNDTKIEDREKDTCEKDDGGIRNNEDKRMENEGVIDSQNPAENNEPILHDINLSMVDLGPSHSDSPAEHKEPRDMTSLPGFSDVVHAAKLDNPEDIYETDSTGTLTQTVSTVSKLKEDKEEGGWSEGKESLSNVIGKGDADRIEDTLTQIEHSEANYFRTEMLEKDPTEGITKSVKQEQTPEDINSSKLEADEVWKNDEDGDGWGEEAEIEVDNLEESKVCIKPTVQSNLDNQAESQEVEVKSESTELSPQKIFTKEDLVPSLLKVDHQEADNVWDDCGNELDEGANIEFKEGMEILPDLQSVETVTTTLSEKLDEIKGSSDCLSKSEVIDSSNKDLNCGDIRISEETKIGAKHNASSHDNLIQPNLDILVENQEIEMRAGSSLIEFKDGHQEADNTWDDINESNEKAGIDVRDIEAKKDINPAETAILSEKMGNEEEFLDYHTESGATEPSGTTLSNKELPEGISVHSAEIFTTVLSKEQDDKESLDDQIKSEIIEAILPSPSNDDISETAEKPSDRGQELEVDEGLWEDNGNEWGEDADINIDEGEIKKSIDFTEVTESFAPSEKSAVERLSKSDPHSLEEQHSEESAKLSRLPKAAEAWDEGDNAWGEEVNLEEIKLASGPIGKHISHEEYFSNINNTEKGPGKVVIEGGERWEDDNWVEEPDRPETVPQLSESNLSNPIQQNISVKLELDLKDSEKKAHLDDDNAAWAEDQDRIKLVPQRTEVDAQTPNEMDTSEKSEVKSNNLVIKCTDNDGGGWGDDDNDWNDETELPGDDMEINKSIADQIPLSNSSLLIPISNQGELEEKRHLITPDINIGDPKDRSKGAKLD
ncbi:unnamed protein product [Hymenolepis diminuta]|uniref:Conserved oligomeric Golgi complex subunit 8 n=1 Tax=Hymenolepis diminuta TaxID=6216 RepID=A0A0R3SDE9_HYMDI|nr:unnamed protein product [Hymenolepis diminuta]